MSNRGGKREGAGRKPGSSNKKSAEIAERLEELGCDPIEGMARIAKEAEDEGDMALAGNMFKELAQYVAAKRKAVEVTGADGNPFETNVNVTFKPVGKKD